MQSGLKHICVGKCHSAQVLVCDLELRGAGGFSHCVQFSKRVPSCVSEGETCAFGAVSCPGEESVSLLTWSVDLLNL